MLPYLFYLVYKSLSDLVFIEATWFYQPCLVFKCRFVFILSRLYNFSLTWRFLSHEDDDIAETVTEFAHSYLGLLKQVIFFTFADLFQDFYILYCPNFDDSQLLRQFNFILQMKAIPPQHINFLRVRILSESFFYINICILSLFYVFIKELFIFHIYLRSSKICGRHYPGASILYNENERMQTVQIGSR